MFKKIACLLFVISTLSFVFAQTKVQFTVSEWPPFEYTENGVYKGSDIELLNAVFKEMNTALEIKVYPWNRCVAMVQNLEADGVLTLSKNAEREAYLVYPNEALNMSRNVIFVRKDSGIKFNTYEDLKGITIGTSAGYSYGEEFDKNTLFKLESAQDEETNFKKLQAGRINAFICDSIVGVYFLKKLKMQGEIMYLPKIVSEFKMYAAFSKKPQSKDLAAKFDKALLAIKKSGVYQKILDSYLK